MPPARPSPDLLTVNEFLAKARISRSTFYLLLRQNAGPPVVKLAGRTFIDRAAADDWIRRQETGAPPPPRTWPGGSPLSKTSVVLRQIAPHKHLRIVFALMAGPRDPAGLAAAAGIDEPTLRQCLALMRSAVAASRDADGRVMLSLASANVAALVAAIRAYYESH